MFKRICFIIFFLSTIFLVFIFGIYPFIKKDEVVQIPDITGYNEIEGLELLESLEIKYEKVYIKGKTNNIKSTIPSVNSLIKKSQSIMVYIEEYEGETIIDFTNMDVKDAKEVLEKYRKEYGIEYVIEYIETDNCISDIVLNQSVSNELLDNIDKIILTVNIYKNYIKMPNFVMSNYKEAFNFCKENGLIFEGIYITSLQEVDTIIYQEIECDKEIRKNSFTRILFYVAK